MIIDARSIVRSLGVNTAIMVLACAFGLESFVIQTNSTMTTGQKFTKRTNDNSMGKVLDHRTRTILNAIMSEPRGKAVGAYLRTRQAGK